MRKIGILSHLVLICVVVNLQHTVVCQSKPIDKLDYNNAFMQSDPTGKFRLWRVIYERSSASPGKKENIKATFEFVSQKIWRQVNTDVSYDKTLTSEVIFLNGTYYCRTDNRPWKKAQFNCSSGSGLGWLPPDYDGEGIASVEDAVLEKTPVKLYKFRVVYKGEDGMERSYERKFWLNRAGQRLRAEAAILVLPTNELKEQYAETYQYNLSGLKIAAPIK